MKNGNKLKTHGVYKNWNFVPNIKEKTYEQIVVNLGKP